MSIAENIIEIKEKISNSAKISGRNLDDIKIIAVTKTIDITRIREVIDNKLTNLGENKVQELIKKVDNIKRDCKWHLIGHLQSNKINQILGKVELIHSIDSNVLLEELNKKSKINNITSNILIQLNISKEESKYGFDKNDLNNILDSFDKYPNLVLKGFMTMAPYVSDEKLLRDVFSQMKIIYENIKKYNSQNIQIEHLSMGMSNDYGIAVEEGSNMVRIGTAIFGDRYKN